MKLRNLAIILALTAGITIPPAANATNGMFLIGYGAKSRSMGGVGIGYTQSAIDFHQNPAGITDIDSTMRVDADIMYFRPIRDVTMPDPRDPPNAGREIRYKSGSNQFLLPSMGGTYKFNRKFMMGFSFVAAAGGSTRYTKLSPLGFNFLNPAGRTDVGDTLGVDLKQAHMSMGGAYKVTKKHSVGAAAVIGIQTFRAYGLGVFKPFSEFPDDMTNRGNDWSYGAGVRFGYKGKIHDRVSIGAAYQSKIYFTELDKYKGLFAEQGGFDSPANIGAGITLRLTDKLDLAFDFQKVFYSDLRSVNNPIENLALAGGDGFLGRDAGAGFGWEDQEVYKIGLKYRINNQWEVATGFNYGEVPMPDDQLLFSTLAPAVTEKHATVGATYKPDKNIEWTVAYVHAFDNTEKGKAESGGQFDQFFPNKTADGPGDMSLRMYQDSLSLSFTYKM